MLLLLPTGAGCDLSLRGSQAEERGDGTWTTGTWPLLITQGPAQPPTGPGDSPPVLLLFLGWLFHSTDRAWLNFGDFFLLCSFLPHLSPFLHPQEFRPSNSSLNHPPHHQCHHFEMLPDATGASAQREKWPFKGKLLHLLGRVLLQAASEVSHNYFMRSSL